MLFVIHAMDKKDAINTRAKHYKAHRQHLDDSEKYGVGVITAGPFVADDNETPIGSLFIIEAKDRAAVKDFHRERSLSRQRRVGSGRVEIHAYHKKRG